MTTVSRRKRMLFALAAVAGAVTATVLLLAIADLYLHARAERSAGLNRWGYRGPVLGRKAPGEIRVAMLGGSTMFGYGGPWDEAIPAMLEAALHQRADGRRIRTINLGFNNEGAFAFVPTLDDFAWLGYDIVCLYPGYNDMMGDAGPNRALYRHASPVFRLTGYFPILPLVLREKAYALRSGGSIEAGYAAERDGVVFTPGVVQETSATTLEAVVGVGAAIGRQIERLSPLAAPATSAETGCDSPWVAYCGDVYRAIATARARGAAVLVIEQPLGVDPSMRRRQQQQQAELHRMIVRHFAGDHRVKRIDLSQAVDLADRDVAPDQMHLSVDGNRIIAAALVEPILAMARVVAGE